MSAAGLHRWKRFWLVGLGNHARTKLAPAILENGQEIAGVVTRQDAGDLAGGRVFGAIEAAIPSMAPGDVVVLASPPAAHFAQCLAAVTAGIDVIVEKPAFTSREEAETIRRIAGETGSLVVEALMHRYTATHARLLEVWRERRARARDVSATFLIPQMPGGTFRQGQDIVSSSLFDIGCYPLSLFMDLGLDPAALSICDVRFPADPMREAVVMAGSDGSVSLRAEVGVGPAYVNRVQMTFAGEEVFTVEPFFFGRPGPRRLVQRCGDGETTHNIDEGDAFRTMFFQPLDILRLKSDPEWERMIATAGQLERLGSQLLARRAT